VETGVNEDYPFTLGGGPAGSKSEAHRVVFDEMIRRIAEDVAAGDPVAVISARFHNTVCETVLEVAGLARGKTGIDRVALSGGVFQNWYLLERSERLLRRAGFTVFTHRAVPSNDGGIALGQLAVAAALQNREK
jgi:hydrogenase maturation protein HypF